MAQHVQGLPPLDQLGELVHQAHHVSPHDSPARLEQLEGLSVLQALVILAGVLEQWRLVLEFSSVVDFSALVGVAQEVDGAYLSGRDEAS